MFGFLTGLTVLSQPCASFLSSLTHFVLSFLVVPPVLAHSSLWVYTIPQAHTSVLCTRGFFYLNCFPTLLPVRNFSPLLNTGCHLFCDPFLSPLSSCLFFLYVPTKFWWWLYCNIHPVHFGCLHMCILPVFLEPLKDRDQVLLSLFYSTEPIAGTVYRPSFCKCQC